MDRKSFEKSFRKIDLNNKAFLCETIDNYVETYRDDPDFQGSIRVFFRTIFEIITQNKFGWDFYDSDLYDAWSDLYNLWVKYKYTDNPNDTEFYRLKK